MEDIRGLFCDGSAGSQFKASMLAQEPDTVTARLADGGLLLGREGEEIFLPNERVRSVGMSLASSDREFVAKLGAMLLEAADRLGIP